MSPTSYLQKNKQKVLRALKSLDYLISNEEIAKYVDLFIKEIKNGLKGKESSLNILPSFIEFRGKLTDGERIAVLEAGQSSFLKGNFKVGEEKLEIYGVMGYAMPGLSKEVGAKEFFRQIILNARDVLRNCEKVGFCFRHAIEADPSGDGKLLAWARGDIQVPELVGKLVGQEFKKHLKEEFGRDYKVIFLNDTVATLIAGLAETRDKEFEDFIGLVHSTGFNLAYIEEGKNLSNIKDSKKYLKSRMVLNTQAGSFAKIKNSKIDKGVYKLLGETPTGSFSQKVNSKCLLLALKVLIEELSSSILNPGLTKRLNGMDDLDLEQMYSFLKVGLKSSLRISSIFRFATLEDASNLGVIIDQIFQRAARLVAIPLCGILKYKDIGHNPIQPVGVIVEGDFFEIVKDFESRVQCEIRHYFGEEDPRYIKFLQVPNATLLGAGIAASDL